MNGCIILTFHKDLFSAATTIIISLICEQDKLELLSENLLILTKISFLTLKPSNIYYYCLSVMVTNITCS